MPPRIRQFDPPASTQTLEGSIQGAPCHVCPAAAGAPVRDEGFPAGSPDPWPDLLWPGIPMI